MYKIPVGSAYDKSLNPRSVEALAAMYALRVLLATSKITARDGFPDLVQGLVQPWLLWSREALAHLRKFATSAEHASRYGFEDVATTSLIRSATRHCNAPRRAERALGVRGSVRTPFDLYRLAMRFAYVFLEESARFSALLSHRCASSMAGTIWIGR